jgi:membrane fusion protein, multidrug efflux system
LSRRGRIGSVLLLAALLSLAGGLAAWKVLSVRRANAALARQPEPMESVAVALAKEVKHSEETTSIGTVMALRSITLRNELAGTVRRVALEPGEVVDAGALLVQLDVSVEEAELKAEKARAALADAVLDRMRRANQNRAASDMEVDQARAELDVARAQIARTEAIIARKTIRAPFRARVGIADVHPGQYLSEGTQLTTLQGVDDGAHVDFTVAQRVAAELHVGEDVEIYAANGARPSNAQIVAIDSRVDPATRNVMIRAKIAAADAPAPGASVRVRVPLGPPLALVAVPVSALRKGPDGDHVFVISPGSDGRMRAHLRPVESGAVLGDDVVIRSGVAVSEVVAASGAFKLREAALVAVANDPAAGSGTR